MLLNDAQAALDMAPDSPTRGEATQSFAVRLDHVIQEARAKNATIRVMARLVSDSPDGIHLCAIGQGDDDTCGNSVNVVFASHGRWWRGWCDNRKVKVDAVPFESRQPSHYGINLLIIAVRGL